MSPKNNRVVWKDNSEEKMFPELYQKVFEIHLNPRQYLTLQLLIVLIQSYRNVSLSKLAELFPQPIQYESRVRNWSEIFELTSVECQDVVVPHH